ncbi:hypothetical protein C8N46_104392 [Kordia periserrulae]|uniref:DinB family protein n=1 Tax=Kordia periserrulae TaxID=701523 RepID=A0A2T6C0B2_9FLAO|nr:hypothetical protein [Kordia periserrulae]PTX61748.1 hypothetical protein C8N46_104392 [Kordia periserrulae]
MNTVIVDSLLITLSTSKKLLNELTAAPYSCKEVAPYYSSIGTHIRHVLDFYTCIFKGLDRKYVDLTSRGRNQRIENDRNCAISEIELIENHLRTLYSADLNELITVEDDLGNGVITIDYTLGALLAQANSHTIHHYAIIAYILDGLGVDIQDENFGYNPTTPAQRIEHTKAS